MRIAVYGKAFTLDARPYVEVLYKRLQKEGVEIALYARLNTFLHDYCEWHGEHPVFETHDELKQFNPDFVITLGGDGTLLDAAGLVRNNSFPILGINTGRLGFLANVAKDEISQAMDRLLAGKFEIEERSTLMVTTTGDVQPEPNFAFNELTVNRTGTNSMITVHAYINGEYLNSYWADGLIIATPTGSTGYSLSCGGPIVMPGSQNFVLTPIAPHNLTVRPFVIPSDYKIRLKIEARDSTYLASLDSRAYTFHTDVELFLQRSDVRIKLIQTDLQNFSGTLRTKLMWGLDRRN